MELRQSPQWGKFLASLGWQTEVIDGCALRIRKLGRLGSIIKIQRPDVLPIEKIEAAGKRHRALFIKIEPMSQSQTSSLVTCHFSPDSWPLTATRTLEIDLTKSEEELLKSFSKDVRQTLKKVESGKLKVESFSFDEIDNEKEKALEEFYRIWKETGARGKFWVPPYKELLAEVKAFGENAMLILASTTTKNEEIEKTGPARPSHQHPDDASGYDNHALPGPIRQNCEPIAGCLLLFCDWVGYYHHAGSTLEGQKLEAPYLVMWQAILESKKRGYKKLDLEGIFDPRFKEMFKKWLGFSVFKLKWGGQVVEYPGAYIKAFNPLIRLLLPFIK